jgi:hypothetical protein
MNNNTMPVVAFGKIVFMPTHESVPPLPDMNLLFFNDTRETHYPWQAVCLDLELDAAGDSMDNAWDNLKEALTLYIAMHRKAAGGDIKAAAKNIIKEAFADSEQKQRLVRLYREVKLEYTMNRIDSENGLDPLEAERRRLATLEAGDDPIRRIVNELRAA